MGKIKIGIIGSGFMGKTYAETIKNYLQDHVELRAISGGSRAEGLATEHKVIYEPSIDNLIKRDDIDAVFITSPQIFHCEYAISAATNGKHILLEKPMAVSVQECIDINKSCEKAKVNLMLAFTQRYRKGNTKAKEIIDSGKIGKIKVMQETMINADGINVYPKWQRDKTSRGTLLAYGIHNIDRIRWFSGSEIEYIAGHYIIDPSKAESEYTSNVFMILKNGVSSSLLCENESPKPGFPKYGFRSIIIGEKGMLDVDAYGEVNVCINEKWETIFIQEPIDWQKGGKFGHVRLESYHQQLLEFINSINEKRQPSVNGYDGQKAVQVALAAYESYDKKILIKL
jgi:myo-inositol 2-dehydrogenase / D-chiro-inositol 1-dehydrogenase